MVNTGVIIPSDLEQLITERQRIMADEATASTQMGKVEQFAAQIHAPTGLQPEQVQLLTIDNLPPAEIDAALAHLTAELHTISTAQQGIDQDNSEIADILRRAKNRTIMMVVAAVVVTVVLIAVVLMAIK